MNEIFVSQWILDLQWVTLKPEPVLFWAQFFCFSITVPVDYFVWMESFKMSKKQRIVYEHSLREGSDFNAGLVSNKSSRPAMVIEMSQNGCRPVWLLTAAALHLALSIHSALFVLNKVILSFILLVTRIHPLYSAITNKRIAMAICL